MPVFFFSGWFLIEKFWCLLLLLMADCSLGSYWCYFHRVAISHTVVEEAWAAEQTELFSLLEPLNLSFIVYETVYWVGEVLQNRGCVSLFCFVFNM